MSKENNVRLRAVIFSLGILGAASGDANTANAQALNADNIDRTKETVLILKDSELPVEKQPFKLGSRRTGQVTAVPGKLYVKGVESGQVELTFDETLNFDSANMSKGDIVIPDSELIRQELFRRLSKTKNR